MNKPTRPVVTRACYAITPTLALVVGLTLLGCSASVDETPVTESEAVASGDPLSDEAGLDDADPSDGAALQAGEEMLGEEELVSKAIDGIRSPDFVVQQASSSEWCCPPGLNPIDDRNRCRQLTSRFGVCLRVRWSCVTSLATRCSTSGQEVAAGNSFRLR